MDDLTAREKFKKYAPILVDMLEEFEGISFSIDNGCDYGSYMSMRMGEYDIKIFGREAVLEYRPLGAISEWQEVERSDIS